ncbi:MAG TPA: hypothetical protein VNR39_00740 [Pseudolabrys sp.]|nr:hypothetical protein [Pseudolabrys sp.]
MNNYLMEIFREQPRLDRISVRPKDIEKFLKKAKARVDGAKKYSEPLSQIQDQIGARIITYFKSDVDRFDSLIRRYFQPIEYRDRIPESEWEFGYFGRHYVLVLPTDVVEDSIDRRLVPDFFELQVKTLFQHAWSEAEHDLGYKPGLVPLSVDETRRLAFTSAQAWGADEVFDDLFRSRENPEVQH